MVYLDYAANTPVEKEVLDLYYETCLKHYANPNSVHKLGRDAKALIDKATKNIAKNLNVLPEEIIYTSGATESNNLVVKGICQRYKNYGKHIILSSLEHNSLMASASAMQEIGFEVDLLPVSKDGLVDINTLEKMIRDDTILVSVCTIDSEIGIVQQIKEIAKLLKKYPNAHLHTDASQAIGKIDIDFNDVDLVTLAPHKFYGLDGISILIKKKNVSLKPMINGGRSVSVYRSGTPNLALILATDKALSIALKNKDDRYKYVLELNKKIIINITKYKGVVINSTNNSIPHIINFSINKVRSLDFAMMLEEKKVYVSTKTSCCPVEAPSKLVYALTKDKNLASSSIRVSISHLTTKSEVDEFLKAFDDCYRKLVENGKI